MRKKSSEKIQNINTKRIGGMTVVSLAVHKNRAGRVYLWSGVSCERRRIYETMTQRITLSAQAEFHAESAEHFLQISSPSRSPSARYINADGREIKVQFYFLRRFRGEDGKGENENRRCSERQMD